MTQLLPAKVELLFNTAGIEANGEVMKAAMRNRAGAVIRKLRGILGDDVVVQWGDNDEHQDLCNNVIVIRCNNRENIIERIERLDDVKILCPSWKKAHVKDAIKMINKDQTCLSKLFLP